MKKLLVLALVAMLSFSVFAQGANEVKAVAETTSGPVKKVALIMQQGGLGDLGFNDTAYAGLVACRDKYGLEINAVECTDTTQGETLIRELCESGYGLIINLEAGISGNMYHVALDYPEKYFVAIGRQLMINKVDGFTTTPKNVIESYITLNEHSFLAGVAAAFVATDGNSIVKGIGENKGCNIGILFGAESVGFYQYGDGFKQGVEFFNPEANVYIDYSVGFSDTANAQNIAQNMIRNMGCDVIWTCCGTAGLGGLEACRLNSAYGIGVDSNQDNVEPGNILTSAIRDNTALITFYVEAYLNGKIEQTEPDVFNLTNGGVGITDMSTIAKYVTSPAKFEELKSLIAQCQAWIAEGKIEVFDARMASIKANGQRLDDWIKTSGKFVSLADLSK